MPFQEDPAPRETGFVADEPKSMAEKPKEMIPHWLKAAVLPTAGAVGGGLIGGTILPGGGAIPGEMIGGAGGEALNQLFGITQPSKKEIAMSGMAAPIGRGIGYVAKPLIGTIAKSFAGRDIMSEAAESLVKKWMAPGVSAKALFAQAEQLQNFVPTIRTPQAIDDILTKELGRAPTVIQTQITEALEPLKQHFIPGSGGIRAILAPELMEESQRLRYLAAKAFEGANPNYKLGNAINSVRAAILDDLENSGASVVKEAAKAYRKEMALEDLGKLFGKPHPVQKIADFMKDNPLFRGAFNDTEKAQINRIAKKLAHVPPSGGSGVWGKIATTAGGFELGGPVGGAAGLFGPEAIRAIMATQFGRNYAERILGSSPTLNHEVLAALAVFAKGMMTRPPKEDQP